MILSPPHQISSIFINDKDIQTVYHNDRIVFQKNKFTTFEINGDNGTVTGSIELPRGTYRIAMCGGGGVGGYSYSTTVQGLHDTQRTVTYKGIGGGGSSLYGIFNILRKTSIDYIVGSVTYSTMFAQYECGGGATVSRTNKSPPSATTTIHNEKQYPTLIWSDKLFTRTGAPPNSSSRDDPEGKDESIGMGVFTISPYPTTFVYNSQTVANFNNNDLQLPPIDYPYGGFNMVGYLKIENIDF